MEQLLATRSVSITELKRSPSAVIEQAGNEPVAVLNHNRPAAYLLPAATYEAMLKQLDLQELRRQIQAGIESGPGIPAEDVFSELTARYAEGETPAASSNANQDA